MIDLGESLSKYLNGYWTLDKSLWVSLDKTTHKPIRKSMYWYVYLSLRESLSMSLDWSLSGSFLRELL